MGPDEPKKQKIVTIGGGAGSFMVLSGLKKYPIDLSAVVSMSDDGGSTGILRDELGVLPPGDVRQCLVALSKSSRTLRELFNYRYSNGGLAGHSFGNIFLSTLEKITGGLDMAIKEASRILRIKGRVLPVTLENARLVARLKNGKEIIGEGKIYANTADLKNLEKLYLKPNAAANPEVVKALKEADKIIINPGDLYSSLIPNFLVKGVRQAMKKSKAKIIYVANLMTKPGHTDGFSVAGYLERLEEYLGENVINYVIYNKELPTKKLLKKYARQGEAVVLTGDLSRWPKIKLLKYDLLSHKGVSNKKSDALSSQRSLIRHDSDKLAGVIYKL